MTDANIDLLSLPMGADPKSDRVVSHDDAGRPIYQSMFGDKYVIDYQMRDPGPGFKGAWEALKSDPVGVASSVASGMAQGVWDGIQVPGRAARGEMITNADMLNSVGLMAGGGGAMAAPKGALRSGALRTGGATGKEAAEEVARLLRSGQGAMVTDDLMAAADQAYLSQIYDLPLDEASRMARARGMFTDAAKAARADKKTPGLRTVDDPAYMTEPSRSWSADGPNGRMLGGTSATSMQNADRAFRMHKVGPDKPIASEGYYYGDTTGVIAGQRVRSGSDAGEVVLKDPVEMLTRNKSARFDPRLSHLRNLSASLAGLGLMGWNPFGEGQK